MTTTNSRLIQDKPGDDGTTELPDAGAVQDLALLNAVRGGAKVIRRSTGKPVTVEELEAELEANSANKSAKPKAKKKQTPSTGDDKYNGMSRDDLIKAHQEAQRKISEQGQEAGQLRNLTDKLLDLKRTEDLTEHGASPADSPISGDTLLTNPRDTINNVVEDSPRLASLEAKVDSVLTSTVETAFAARHPNYQNDMTTPEFQAWVKNSPYRLGLAQKAYNKDWDAAEELFNAFDEVRDTLFAEETDDGVAGENSQGNTVVSATVGRDEALAAAQMLGGNSAPGDVSAKPIYSRQAIINKRIQDPTGYYDPAFQAILKDAYDEGRVK